ncbi:MAG: Rrf2 family transcriptional regulator, partial [Lachnospiraceae bacterium]|nr:Rrf2 family transcriptional regulator [Lachnospiraceae bacterium]
MKYSTRLSDAIHILVLIAINPLDNMTSMTFANSINTNAGFIRQIMSALKKANLIISVHGHATPSLSKEPECITLLEIYRAIEGNKPFLHLDTHTNPECGVGVNIQYSIQDFYNNIQHTAEQEMSKITLKDIINNFEDKLKS